MIVCVLDKPRKRSLTYFQSRILKLRQGLSPKEGIDFGATGATIPRFIYWYF